MHYLYGYKSKIGPTLLATFDNDSQLRAYVHWATLKTDPDGSVKFEQGTALAGGYNRWEASELPLTDESVNEVPYNPTPSML